MNAGDMIGALFVRIGADLNDLHLGLGPGGKADKELEGFTKRVNAGLGNLLKFGAGLAGIGLVAVAIGLGVAAKSAMDFEQSMKLLQTQAGASADEVRTMSSAVLDLAGKVAMSPEELAKGLYHLESAGFRGAQALQALTIAAEGAKVGNADLEDVTNALDAVLVAGVPEAKDMTAAMGELNAIVGAGDMRMQDLADAMGTGILASAKTFGLGLKDVGAALAVMGDNNIRGADAATKLRMSISLMGATTDKAAAALKKIGISSTQLADDMRSGGLVKALADLQKHLKDSGMSATEQARILSEAFGGGKSAGTILLLLQQLDRLKAKEEEIGKGAGGFQAAWQATQQNFTFQWQAATAALQAAGIKIGTVLLPYLSQMLKFVTPLIPLFADWAAKSLPGIVKQLEAWGKDAKPVLDFLKWGFDNFDKFKGYLIDVGLAWVAWNVALAVTRGFAMVQFLIQLITQSYIAASATEGMSVAQWLLNAAMDANPIGLIIIAIAALAAGVIYAYTHFKWFRDFVNGAWDTLKNFGNWISHHAGPIFSALGKLILDVATGQIMSLPGDVSALKSAAGFATGGIVPGPIGQATLAVVHGGERVLTPQQQQMDMGSVGGSSPVVVTLTPARLNNPQDLLDALYALMSAAETRRRRGATGFLGSVG